MLSISRSTVDEQSARTFRGVRNLAESITTWLVDVGSWIFGGRTALNLVMLSAVITVGSVDAAIRMSAAALTAALPFNVADVMLLRLTKDANDAALDDLTLRAFQDAGSRYWLGIATGSIASTVNGLAAALWHVGHWIALVLLSAIILSAGLVTAAIAHALPREPAHESRLATRVNAAAKRMRSRA